MIYEYECHAGHVMEVHRPVDKRRDPIDCHECGMPARLIVSQIAKPIVWGSTHEASGGGTVAGGPRAHARYLKEHDLVDLSGHSPEQLREMNAKTRAENDRQSEREISDAVDKVAGEMGDALWTV